MLARSVCEPPKLRYCLRLGYRSLRSAAKELSAQATAQKQAKKVAVFVAEQRREKPTATQACEEVH